MGSLNLAKVKVLEVCVTDLMYMLGIYIMLLSCIVRYGEDGKLHFFFYSKKGRH